MIAKYKVEIISIVGLMVYFIMAIHRPVISDEIHEAHLVNGLFKDVPYWDKVYYKNVLGYYIKYPLLKLGLSWWNSIIASRIFLAFLFVGTLYLVARCFRERFSSHVLVCGLVCSLSFTQNLAHATAYRVDMLTALFGLGLLAALFFEKYFLAGLLGSISFFISQKGGLYCAAGFLSMLFISFSLKNILQYSLGGGLVAIAYVSFWTIGSDFFYVLDSIFFKDIKMATSAGYQIRGYWIKSFFANPLIYSSFLAGVFIPFLRKTKDISIRRITVFNFFLLVFCLSLGQPWPYFFVILLPTLFSCSLLFVDYLEIKKGQNFLYGYLVLCIFYSICSFSLTQNLGNQYQQFHIEMMEQILSKGDSYLAGINLHPDYVQSIEELKLLTMLDRNRVKQMSTNNKNKLIAKIKTNPPKLLISNYRTVDLGTKVSGGIYQIYKHWWGNLFVYSLKLNIDSRKFWNGMSGRYIVNSSTGVEIEIDKILYRVGSIVELSKGEHFYKSDHQFSLTPLLNISNGNLPKEYFSPRSLNFTYEL